MPQTQPNMFSSNVQPQQSFGRPGMFQQPMMQQQQFNKPNTNSFNNIWTSAQGKLDISLNNLIPYTRGDPQKSNLSLNQLTSPTSPGFPSNTQAIFSAANKN
jgi:hypothetical protein